MLCIDDEGEYIQKQIRSLAYTRAGLEAHATVWIERLYDDALGYKKGPLPAIRDDRSSWLKQMHATKEAIMQTNHRDERTAKIFDAMQSMLSNTNEDL